MSTNPSPASRRVLRAWFVAGALGGLALLHFGSAGGLSGLLSDLWEYRSQREGLAHDRERTAELDSQFAATAERAEFRQALLDQVVEGQLPLTRAVAEYRAFTAGDPAFAQILASVANGSDESERLANYLLTSLTSSRSLAPVTRQRLAAEFRAAYGRDPEFRTAVGQAAPDSPVVHQQSP